MTDTIHIVLAMKPIEGNFSQNAIEHEVAGLNIDGCRVESDRKDTRHGGGKRSDHIRQLIPDAKGYELPSGRFPANVIHDGSDLTGFGDEGTAARFFKECKPDD